MSVVITLFSIVITVGMYLLSLTVARKYPSPLTMPIFFCTVTIILILLVSRVTYEQYTLAKDIMTYLLGPATVALAVPLYRQRKIIYKNMLPVLIGILGGTTATIVAAMYMAIWFELSNAMTLSFSIKSITIPIASEVAHIINADPSLVMAFVMITGIIGAMFGPWFLNIGRVTNPMARGLSYGTISHGIGTSQAMQEGEIEGAASGVAMGVAAILTSLTVPWILPMILG